METKKFLRIALEAGDAASGLLLSCSRKLDIRTKSAAHDLVTDLDLKAEKLIRSIINKAHPTHSIFGEEFGFERKDADYVWIVDPIDGTTSFVERRSGYGISIALAHRGEVIVAVVVDPAANEVFHAAKGKGAFKDRVLMQRQNSDMCIALKNNAEPYRSTIDAMMQKAAIDWQCGTSTALALAHVAEGKAACATKLTCNPWDIAAGILIASEAGVGVADFDSNKHSFLDPGKRHMRGFIACYDRPDIIKRLEMARIECLKDR